MITATSRYGRQSTRNISFFKKITGDTSAKTQQEEEDKAEDNSEVDDIAVPTQPRVIQQQQPIHQPERHHPKRIRCPPNRLANFIV